MPSSSDAPLTCRHFGPCGGCTALDVPIATQLAQKQQRARDLLAPFLDGLEPVIALPPRAPRHDRSTILYPARPRRDGNRTGIELGIYRRGTHEIEPIVDCRIQHKALTVLGVRTAEVLDDLELPAYDERTQLGLVRALRARVMPGTNELLVGIVATTTTFPGRDALARRLERAASDLRDDQGRPLTLAGIVLNENGSPGNVLLGPRTIVLRGADHQWDAVGALRLRVSFASFYQQNRYADAILFRPALALLGSVAGQRIVDGYGGVGAFALRFLRDGAAHVTLVESSASACADARAGLAANGFSAAEVRHEAFGSTALPPCDVLVADPPRAGLMEQGAAAVLAAAPPRVLLVSCALESLARDLTRLVGDYRVVALRLCDLFPHTEHVEAVTLLERR